MKSEDDWRRIERRNELWPDANSVVYRAGNGLARTPRTVPLVAALIDELSPNRERSGRLYMTLWAHEEDGFVEVSDPEQIAFEAGYWTSRATRTFEERVDQLVSLGFVRQESDGIRSCGFVLLLDPHLAVQKVHAFDATKIPQRWLKVFEKRCRAIGVKL